MAFEEVIIGNARLILGDCREVLPTLSPVSAVVTDPPYGLKFMGKRWDYDVPSTELWALVLDRLLPGAHMLAFAGTRTQHRMAVRIEDAGFEIRDMLAWVYGCLSDDSEVLTREGWEHYHTARHKEILAYDPQADVYQWERPSRWSEYRVESDTAYRIKSDQTDQIVSRGHRCLVERGGMLAFVPADELADVERVPYLQGDVSALSQGRGELLLADLLRQGEGLAEATLCERQGQETSGQGDGWAEEPCVEGRANVLQAERQVRRPVDQVRSLSVGVRGYGSQGWLRDGTSLGGGDDAGAVAVAERVRTSYQPRRDGQSAGEPDAVCDKCGSQAIRARTTYRTTMATVTAIEYTGLIFCPTVSTGAFVARRNGKAFVTGNSGFPKSLDVGKAIDKAAGMERDVISSCATGWSGTLGGKSAFSGLGGAPDVRTVTAPATEAARQWDGWGTALKPSFEPITLARKPLAGTVAANVMEHGTGGLNIDGCRVETTDKLGGGAEKAEAVRATYQHEGWDRPWMHDDEARAAHARRVRANVAKAEQQGRWPANLIHDGSDEVLAAFPHAPGQQGRARTDGVAQGNNIYGALHHITKSPEPRADAGSAARFFYCAKAAAAERGEGNDHPTVKPLALMRWLLTLVVPPGGLVLDPFLGSGSTGVAAIELGMRFVGVERDRKSFDIACARIEAAQRQGQLLPHEKPQTPVQEAMGYE